VEECGPDERGSKEGEMEVEELDLDLGSRFLPKTLEPRTSAHCLWAIFSGTPSR